MKLPVSKLSRGLKIVEFVCFIFKIIMFLPVVWLVLSIASLTDEDEVNGFAGMGKIYSFLAWLPWMAISLFGLLLCRGWATSIQKKIDDDKNSTDGTDEARLR